MIGSPFAYDTYLMRMASAPTSSFKRRATSRPARSGAVSWS